jgi:hypothetical protein
LAFGDGLDSVSQDKFFHHRRGRGLLRLYGCVSTERGDPNHYRQP